MLDVAVGDGKSTKVLLKEVQHHPLTDRIIHVDFQKVSLTDKFKVLVPIEVVGEPIGVTRDGGILELLVREVEVECLPSDIPGQLEIEVSALEIGGHLSLADLVIGSDAVTLSDDSTITVAQVSAPRVVDDDTEETEGEEEESTSTEPEVITERSSDETDDSAD
jgi:large subunit ribosomal protein L25